MLCLVTRPATAAGGLRTPYASSTEEDASNWLVARYQKKPAKVVAAEVDTVIKIMAIADANKPLILQHSTVIDDLMSGLLLDECNPDPLQSSCGLR